jgi:hypothetical protein
MYVLGISSLSVSIHRSLDFRQGEPPPSRRRVTSKKIYIRHSLAACCTTVHSFCLERCCVAHSSPSVFRLLLLPVILLWNKQQSKTFALYIWLSVRIGILFEMRRCVRYTPTAERPVIANTKAGHDWHALHKEAIIIDVASFFPAYPSLLYIESIFLFLASERYLDCDLVFFLFFKVERVLSVVCAMGTRVLKHHGRQTVKGRYGLAVFPLWNV